MARVQCELSIQKLCREVFEIEHLCRPGTDAL